MQTSPEGYTVRSQLIGLDEIRGQSVLFGWNIGVSKFIFGGRRGYSGGNESRARKNPPV